MPCSVVIPCHNGVELTRACIASLLDQEGSRPDEILIVDNDSSDETERLDRVADAVRVLPQPRNLGFAAGVNAGLRAARFDEVLVLNNDTLAAPNLLVEMQSVLRSDTLIGACAPVSNEVKREALLRVGNLGRDPGSRRRLATELEATAPRLQDVETLSGLCLLIRRDTLQRVGLLDERFGHGNYEDDDLSLRLRLHGYRLVIARRAFLHHEGHATFRALDLDLGEQMASRLEQFCAKWRHHPAGLATIHAMHGEWQAAAAAASTARHRCPGWLDADLHLGRHYEAIGEVDAATRHLRRYLRRCPEHVDARIALGLALMRTDHSELGRGLLTATPSRHRLTDGQQVWLLQRLGQLLYEQGQHAAAGEHFGAALLLMPESGELHNWSGLCLLARHQYRTAAAAFAAAVRHGHVLAHTNLGICQHALGDHDAATASFREAATRLPDDAVARSNYQAVVAAGTGAMAG